MAFKFLKNFVKKLLGKKEPEKKECTSFDELWKEFASANFCNGTLVEYASTREGHHYSEVETNRETIRDYASDYTPNPEKVCLLTPEGQYPIIKPLRDIKKKNGVFYVDPVYYERNYAIAPNGVKIPKKPSLESISKEKRREIFN